MNLKQTNFPESDEATIPLLVQHICSNFSEEDRQGNSVQKGIIKTLVTSKYKNKKNPVK